MRMSNPSGSSKSSKPSKSPRRCSLPSLAIILARKSSRITSTGKRYLGLDDFQLAASSARPPSRHDGMHVRVEVQLSRPSVQHHRDAELRIEARASELQVVSGSLPKTVPQITRAVCTW